MTSTTTTEPTTAESNSRRRRASLTSRLATLLLTPHPPEYVRRSLGIPGLPAPGTARVARVDRPGPEWTELTLLPGPGFTPPPAGGALTLGVTVNGVVHRRCYSPVTPPGAPDAPVTLAVRRHQGGLVSDYLWQHAAPGDEVLLEPQTTSTLRPPPAPEQGDEPTTLVLVSGGSGLTPMLALAEAWSAEHPGARIAWLHYCPDRAELPVRGRIARLRGRPGVSVTVVETRRPRTEGELTGHFTAAHLEHVVPWAREAGGAALYICGPAALEDAFAAVVGPERWAETQRERFRLDTATPAPEGQGPGTVRFAASGTELEPGQAPDDAGILALAEAAGLTPEHGCRMGICHTCTARITYGTTRDLRTGELASEPGRDTQICVSAPVGDVVVDL